MGPFELLSDGSSHYRFHVQDVGRPSTFTVFDISDRLRVKGWQVPTYTMPEDATDVAVLRVVVREGFSLIWPARSSRHRRSRGLLRGQPARDRPHRLGVRPLTTDPNPKSASDRSPGVRIEAFFGGRPGH